MRTTKISLLTFCLAFSSIVFSHAHQQEKITVMHAWSRAVHMAGMNAAGYMTLINNGDKPEQLVAIKTEIAKKAMLHETIHEGDMVKMESLKDGIEIPANGQVKLKPGGKHVMLMKIKRPLKEGDRISVTLVFQSGTEINTYFAVQPPGGESHKHH